MVTGNVSKQKNERMTRSIQVTLKVTWFISYSKAML